MKPISKLRFNALAGYARNSEAEFHAEELGWYQHGNERVLGTLIKDSEDGDYAALIFGRDRLKRFRCLTVTNFYKSKRLAEVNMRREMEITSHQDDSYYYQGDEIGLPVDYFMPVVSSKKMHSNFVAVANMEGYLSAKGVIEAMMCWFGSPDGNFVEQFQTTGFDSRIWELYLFAAFREMGYVISRSGPIPDFSCIGVRGEFCVEATTVNASESGPLSDRPDLNTGAGQLAFLHEYMPMKYGSALHSKLNKEYWNAKSVKGKPLIFAIADFQGDQSMTMSRSSLPIYLYGYDHDWHKDENGKLHIIPRKVKKHRWGNKDIPSGFFDQPNAEQVSAVVFSNSGTVSKFLRMGKLAGFGSEKVKLLRVGTAVNHDPDATEPQVFQQVVDSLNYRETWVEGLDVFHNPNAILPLEEYMFPGASHHWLLSDGQVLSQTPDWHPLASRTLISVEEDLNQLRPQA